MFSNEIKSLYINGNEVRKLYSGDHVFYEKKEINTKYKRLVSVTSIDGNSWVDTGVVGDFIFNANMSIRPRDSRGLMGLGAGRGQYFGASSSLLWNTEPSVTIAGSNTTILQDITFSILDNVMSLTAAGTTVSTSGITASSATWQVGKGIGTDYQGDFTFTSFSMVVDGVTTEYIPVKLLEDIDAYNGGDSGSVGAIGFWNITEDKFHANKGSRSFSYIESAVESEYELITAIRNTNGSFVNTWYYPKCNDNISLTISLMNTNTWHSNGLQRSQSSVRCLLAQNNTMQARMSITRNNGTEYALSSTTGSAGDVITMQATSTGLVITNETTSSVTTLETNNRGTNRAVLPFYIGAFNNSMAGYSLSGTPTYAFDATARDGTLLYSFRPAKIISSNEIVWVDLVGMNYYRPYNGGTFEEVS